MDHHLLFVPPFTTEFYPFFSRQGGSIDILSTLVMCGAQVQVPSKDEVGMYPLHWACTEGHLRVVTWVRCKLICQLLNIIYPAQQY